MTARAVSPDRGAPSAPAPEVVGELRQIPLGDLIESPWNPRKHFDPARLAEMVDSLKKGQLAPIIVRPTTMRLASTTRYEIGAGHRRFRAAPAAGLTSLLAIVRDLDDVAFLELLTIENKQRDDVAPLDEANGFRLLMEKAGYDVAKLAARVGLSTKYVYDRLKLLQLIPEARTYLEDCTITAGHAILLARLTPTDQKRAIGNPSRINRYGYRDGTGLFQAEYAEDDPDQPGLELKQPVKARSVRELATWINDHVRFDPTKNDLPNLFPAAAAALKAVDEDDLAPVYITYDHMLKFDAKDHKVRTYGVSSWRRADGREKSKTCAWSRIGIVAAGRDRGDVFRVCVNRDKCEVHFKASAKRRTTPRAHTSPSRAPSGGGTSIQENLERERVQRHDQRVEDVVLRLIGERAPQWALGVIAVAKQIKLPAEFASWMAGASVLEPDLENIQYGDLGAHGDDIFAAVRPKLGGGWSKRGRPETAAAQPVGMALLFWLNTSYKKLEADLEREAEKLVRVEEQAAAKAKPPAKKKAKK